MKRTSLALAFVLPLMVATLAFGQTTPPPKNTGYIKGSKHDFSAQYTGMSGTEICKPCHTPHNAIEQDVSDRLWAHTLSTASYTVAGGETLTQEEALDGYSRLCMGCHDGTVALDSFAGANPGTGPFGANSPYNVGTDLSNDHPVGKEAVYDGTRSSLNNTSTNSRGQTVVGSLPLRPVEVLDTGGNVTATNQVVSCGTCHNPHGAGTGGVRYPSLLRATNVNSALCMTCHIK
jgi:predicted CXXCH cytochrome family protein